MEKDAFVAVEELDFLGFVILEEGTLLHLFELGFGLVDLGETGEETAEDDLRKG